jgi:hypothetical protein
MPRCAWLPAVISNTGESSAGYAGFSSTRRAESERLNAFCVTGTTFAAWRRGRRPEQAIDVAPPTERLEVDAAIAHEHALAREPAHLLAERAAARRERDAAVRTQHALPRQAGVACLAEHAADQPRAAGQAGAARNFAVAGDATLRDRGDRGADRLVRGGGVVR